MKGTKFKKSGHKNVRNYNGENANEFYMSSSLRYLALTKITLFL